MKCDEKLVRLEEETYGDWGETGKGKLQDELRGDDEKELDIRIRPCFLRFR